MVSVQTLKTICYLFHVVKLFNVETVNVGFLFYFFHYQYWRYLNLLNGNYNHHEKIKNDRNSESNFYYIYSLVGSLTSLHIVNLYD